MPAAGNLISGNGSDGVRISGPVATRTIVAANMIGLAPGGGYLFGTGNPGNGRRRRPDRRLRRQHDRRAGLGLGQHDLVELRGGGLHHGCHASTGNTILNNMIG